MKTICFTGHRPNKLGGYKGIEADRIQQYIREQTMNAIGRAYINGFREFISGGALGFDQIAAEVIIGFKQCFPDMFLIIARPFPDQHIKWTHESQIKFNYILSQADKIIDVSPNPYSVEKMHLRNKWMVDNSEAIISCWNGDAEGGTRNCIAYAMTNGRSIYNINPSAFTASWIS